MSDTSHRCEPPPEFRGERWHWLISDTDDGELIVAEWCNPGWLFTGDDSDYGTRYVQTECRWHSVARPGEPGT